MSWRMKSELWETQALGYWILGWLVWESYPTIGYTLMGYGTICAVGAVAALFRTGESHADK